MSIGAAQGKPWYADVPRSTKAPTLFGVGVVAAIVGTFVVWGEIAPIAGAVVSSGIFVASGQNKVVQHLEGGVIREILVREGDIVEPDQTLVVLDNTAPKAESRRLTLRHIRSKAMDARLQAEAHEQDEFSFSPDIELAARTDPDVAKIVESQRLTFEARRKNLKGEIATLQESINGLQERVQGTRIQIKGVKQQISIISEELVDKNQLLKSGLIRRPEVLSLQRMDANLQGEVGRLTGEMGDTMDRIARAKEQIAVARSTAVKTAVEQLHEVRAEQYDLREKINSAQGVLSRITITAPIKGVVVKMRYNTKGGVIEAGKSIMEIVPMNEPLLIEARVRPQDIDHVKVGQAAVVRLSALSKRLTPMIPGEVTYVSADALPDEKRGQVLPADAYVVRVRLDPLEVAQIDKFVPTPGMPAEIYIKTKERTFFEYLTQPIKDSMSRAFREW